MTKTFKFNEEITFNNFSLTPVTMEFAEDGGVWIEALQARVYKGTQYGDVEVTTDKLERMASSVKNNVRGIQLSTDYEHGEDAAKGKKASGTIKDARVEGDKLLLNVDFTDTAKQEISSGEWKYFSSDWRDKYIHEDGTEHVDVLFGGGLTNRPVAKGLATLPINFSELYGEIEHEFAEWSTAYKNNLPDSAFLYVESGGKKDSEGKTVPRALRHFPVKDSSGNVDRVHVEKAIQLAPKSSFSESIISSVQTKARRLLNSKRMGEPMNELLKRMAEQLGIQFSETDDEDAVSQKVFAELTRLESENTALTAEVEPLRKLKETADTSKSFAEQYPEQAAQMEEDRKFRIEAASDKFVSTIASKRFSEGVGKKDAEGNDVIVTTTKGLSAKALDLVKATHLKFSEGDATVEDFTKTIDAIFEDGIVDYGESGTSAPASRSGDDDTVIAGSTQELRLAFAEKVNEIRAEQEGRTFAEALPIAAQKYPKMYEAYMGSGVVA